MLNSCIAHHQVQQQLFTRLGESRKTALRKGSNTFFRFVKPSKKDTDILTRDGHSSHSRNVEVIDSAREHGV